MKFAAVFALFLAFTIAVAIAAPSRYYEEDDEEDIDERTILAPRRPYTLSTAPFYFQSRAMEELPVPQQKYEVIKKSKKPKPQSTSASDEEDDEPQDDDGDESSEEDEEEDEESMDVPPWEELFPDEDKNTGMFDDQHGSGIGGGPLADATLPGGAPAPEGTGLMSLFSGGSDVPEGPPGPVGPPPGPPPPSARGRSFVSEEDDDDDDDDVEQEPEPRSVLFDGYRYIPVRQVQVRVPQRQPKKVKKTNRQHQHAVAQERSLRTSSSSSHNRQNSLSHSERPHYIYYVPYQQRGNREFRFTREEEGYRLDSQPVFAPSEIWRWEGPGGRPLRRRENRPSGLYYAPRPQRGSASSTIRFSEENDY